MKLTLRQALAHSHTAAIAIAVLLVWSAQLLASHLVSWLFVTGTILADVASNFFSPRYRPFLWREELKFLPLSWVGPEVASLLNAVSYVAVAWLLARWVYGQGPLVSLRAFRDKLFGRIHV